MNLPDGVKIYVGRKVFKGEIPDDKIPAGLNKGNLQKKLKIQQDEAKKAAKSEESRAD